MFVLPLAAVLLAIAPRQTLGRRAIASTCVVLAALPVCVSELRPEPGWPAVAVVVTAAHGVTHGWMQRALALVVGPALVIATWAAIAPLATSRAAATALALVLAGLTLGAILKRVLGAAALESLAIVGGLAGAAALIAPPLMQAWLRSAVAREGTEPTAATEHAWWPAAVALGAIALGAAWGTWRARRGLAGAST